MNNFTDLKNFLEQASVEEKEIFLSKQSGLLKALSLAILSGDFKDFQELALEEKDSYIDFVNKFYHQEIDSKLFFASKQLLFNLSQAQASLEYVLKVYNQLDLNEVEKLNLALSLSGEDSLDLEYYPKNKNYSLKANLKSLDFLLDKLVIKEDEELDLLSSVYDNIPMEVVVQGGVLMGVVKNNNRQNIEANKASLITKFSLIVSRIVQSPVTKYVGVSLALGLVLTGEASASVTDAAEYLKAVNNSLSQMDVPTGCEFGVKIISKNSIGINYEVQLGDYISTTNYTKVGSFSENFEQNLYKLKEAKGCGLTKSDATEMASKVSKMVTKLWSK